MATTFRMMISHHTTMPPLAYIFINMLHLNVSNSSLLTTHTWWNRLRPRLTIVYLMVALALLALSAMGHMRLLSELGQPFGGFFWAIDTDRETVVVSPSQLVPIALPISANSLTRTDSITEVNGKSFTGLTQIYSHTHLGESITYTTRSSTFQQSVVTFTLDIWWQSYGLALMAGLIWLVVGLFLLATAQNWRGAVEGMTLLPVAMLFLLCSHWGNVHSPYVVDMVFQLLWIPSFALLGAAFIHLSLIYRPEALNTAPRPRLVTDSLPYLPLLAILAYVWSSYVIFGHVSTRLNLLVSMGYAVLGGIIGFCISIHSLIRIGSLRREQARRMHTQQERIPINIRRGRELLTLWTSVLSLSFCLCVLPILLTGNMLLPLPVFYTLAIIYPLTLAYAIHSLRLIESLQSTLEQRDATLLEQQKTTEALRQTNREAQQAVARLLDADVHLRSQISQQIHDQPRQQALRVRSLLAYWQHKMRVEAELEPTGKVSVQLVIETLGKIRKISDALEGDLRKLQLLVEDYQRRSLDLKTHLEKLIREDLPDLYPESPLQVQDDLRALDVLGPNLEQTAEGARIAEAISYTITQALLNIYKHSAATFATVRTTYINGMLEVYVIDDGRGFDLEDIPSEKTSLFKAQLKSRAAGGVLIIQSAPHSKAQHGTTVLLRIPLPGTKNTTRTRLVTSKSVEKVDDKGAVYRAPR